MQYANNGIQGDTNVNKPTLLALAWFFKNPRNDRIGSDQPRGMMRVVGLANLVGQLVHAIVVSNGKGVISEPINLDHTRAKNICPPNKRVGNVDYIGTTSTPACEHVLVPKYQVFTVYENCGFADHLLPNATDEPRRA